MSLSKFEKAYEAIPWNSIDGCPWLTGVNIEINRPHSNSHSNSPSIEDDYRWPHGTQGYQVQKHRKSVLLAAFRMNKLEKIFTEDAAKKLLLMAHFKLEKLKKEIEECLSSAEWLLEKGLLSNRSGHVNLSSLKSYFSESHYLESIEYAIYTSENIIVSESEDWVQSSRWKEDFYDALFGNYFKENKENMDNPENRLEQSSTQHN